MFRFPHSPRWFGGVGAIGAALCLVAGAHTVGAQPTTTTPSGATADAVAGAPSGAEGDGGGSVDVLRADATEVRAALEATVSRRAEAQASLVAAREAATAAAEKVTVAEAEERRAAERADELDERVKEAKIAAFVGSNRDVPLGVLGGQDVKDSAWEATILRYRAEEFEALLEEQRVAHRALAERRGALAATAAAARAAEQQAAGQVDALVQLENDQARLVAQVEDRLDAALAEAAAVAELDAQAAAGLAAQEQQLAQAVASMAVAPAAPPIATPVAAAPTTTAVPRTPTPTPAPAAPTTTAAPPAPPVTVPPTVSVDTVSVGPFIVARAIADPLARMLAAGQAAGFTFGGSGYRDVNVQISLRRSHCGPTDYDIWVRPASQCSPPTAIPGRSMHEKGLAVDLTCQGTLISSRSNPCFVWLAGNAASYGFYNLPSEPWHWSTNGN